MRHLLDTAYRHVLNAQLLAEISGDLHTSRVVVSRILKQLEKEGRLELHRNRIEVLDF